MHLRLQSRTGPEKLSLAFRFLFPLVRIATSGPAEQLQDVLALRMLSPAWL